MSGPDGSTGVNGCFALLTSEQRDRIHEESTNRRVEDKANGLPLSAVPRSFPTRPSLPTPSVPPLSIHPMIKSPFLPLRRRVAVFHHPRPPAMGRGIIAHHRAVASMPWR
jgi:hypothetical protein